MANNRRLRTRAEHRAKLDRSVDEVNALLIEHGFTGIIAKRVGDSIHIQKQQPLVNLTEANDVNIIALDEPEVQR